MLNMIMNRRLACCGIFLSSKIHSSQGAALMMSCQGGLNEDQGVTGHGEIYI